MSLRSQLETIIKKYKHEIVEEGDWFYALDNYELNVHDYDEDGVFEVCLSPRKGCETDWSKIYLVPSLNFSI
jgi:hypothetical protein